MAGRSWSRREVASPRRLSDRMGRSGPSTTRDLAIGADLVVGLGGDGTMMRAVDLAAEEDVPVLGVNVGQLGYLTMVEPQNARVALKRFLAGAYSLEERMRLEITVSAATARSSRWVARSTRRSWSGPISGHTVRLEVSLDGNVFTPYVADGVIVATPTGSTAYTFSARGPIIDPRHRALLLVPVAPHMLFDRALVLDPLDRGAARREASTERRISRSTDATAGVLEVGDRVDTGHVHPRAAARHLRGARLPSGAEVEVRSRRPLRPTPVVSAVSRSIRTDVGGTGGS